jgi:hypothetical protein
MSLARWDFVALLFPSYHMVIIRSIIGISLPSKATCKTHNFSE